MVYDRLVLRRLNSLRAATSDLQFNRGMIVNFAAVTNADVLAAGFDA